MSRVHLRLRADPATGTVIEADIVSGAPVLTASALAAARRWRFAPGSVPQEPFVVALRFQVDCAAP